MKRAQSELFYGGDYNPEQWDQTIWQEDMRLMKQANVNYVSINIFSWAKLQPNEDTYDFSTLDQIMNLLHENQIYVDLATATASPPAWLSIKYPSTLPMGASGKIYTHGSRQHYCPNSEVYRKLAAALVTKLAQRYQNHPALVMWHINNEYGCHISECYCKNCINAFRIWLQTKYQTLDLLNQAWSTNFWSQTYYQWEEILLPAKTPNGFENPGQLLDYKRFMSDSLLDCYKLERDIIKTYTPNIPVMTNLLGLHKAIDGFKWAREMDIATWDSYPEPNVKISYGDMMANDLSRSLKKQPFLLMEQAANHINWRAYNPSKRPGQMRLHSYQSLAHGADGIMFFQWRASLGGAEKFHSGMVNHCGSENNRTYQEIVALGQELQHLKELTGTQIYAKVGIIFDWENWWALELNSKPTALSYLDQVSQYYCIIRDYNISVDFVHPDEELTDYKLIIAPALYLVTEQLTEKIENYVADGGTFLTHFFSGYVNEYDQIYAGGYPGALKRVLGLVVTEFDAMIPQWTRHFSYQNQLYSGNVWADSISLTTATALGHFTEDYYADKPAITYNKFGNGESYYMGTQPETAFLQLFIKELLDKLAISAPLQVPKDVEVTVRENEDYRYLFFLNYNHEEVTIPLKQPYFSCLAQQFITRELKLATLGVEILREKKNEKKEYKTMSYKEIPTSIQDLIHEINDKCGAKHPRWAENFKACYANTLLTTVKRLADGTTYVFTGDIPAMWLRDSAAQVRPYLVLAKQDPDLANMIAGLIQRQFLYICLDPYANAFNEEGNNMSYHEDKTAMNPWIWERKYEVDSLCYPIQLSYLLWKATGTTSHFNDTFLKGVKTILDTWQIEQNHENSRYLFERDTSRKEDTLSHDGKGTPVGYTGMTWSGFRPSDDSCEYGYLIPANMFAVVVLDYLQEIFVDVLKDEKLIPQIAKLRVEIQTGIETYGKIKTPQGETLYAYEVDGLGNYKIMDDANVPSLLSAPYLGYCEETDPTYIATRKQLLSPENPYFYEGKYAKGIGSPHTPKHYIWPIALAIQGLTTSNKQEKETILNTLVACDAGTNLMHEGFHVDDPNQYTREWFSWANMMFCELVMDYFDIRVPQ